MKNNILIILLVFCQIFFLDKVPAKEIEFNASDIEITNDQNLTIANNAIVTIKDDKIIVEGLKIEYFKDQSLIIVNKGKISKIDKSLIINADIIKYYINDGKLNFKNKVKINDKINNLIIHSSKIYYDINNQTIIGQENSKILDEFDNIYNVNEFEYSGENKIIKLDSAKVLDKNKNSFQLDIAYLDLINK